MHTPSQLLQDLSAGRHDPALAALYALDGTAESLDRARERAEHVVQCFIDAFSPAPETSAALFSGPGRTEIGGNHTDHQHGHVLCGSVDLDMLACAAPNGLDVIRIHSEGYPALEVSLNSLAPREEEKNISAALVRGVASRIAELGYRLCGFDAYVTSNVLSGSGLSSSAAYEVLMGNVLNRLCCGGALDPVAIAKIGQYAENVYFGKPCGLMDQMGASVGGAVAIDFQDPASPVVRRADYDFSASGHALCIVDTASSHGDLTDDYADITREMGAVAAYFGQRFLRDVPEKDFRAALPALRQACGDRAVLRPFTTMRTTAGRLKRPRRWKTGISPASWPWSMTPACPLPFICRIPGPSPIPGSRRSRLRWQSAGSCWAEPVRSASTAADSPERSRRLFPMRSLPASRRGWKPCSEQANVMFFISVRRAVPQ